MHSNDFFLYHILIYEVCAKAENTKMIKNNNSDGSTGLRSLTNDQYMIKMGNFRNENYHDNSMVSVIHL